MPTNPDLSEFEKRGGRLITYFGWADPALNPMMGVNYYERVRRTMGERPDEQLLPAVHGARHVPLPRWVRSRSLRRHDAAHQLGRERQGALSPCRRGRCQARRSCEPARYAHIRRWRNTLVLGTWTRLRVSAVPNHRRSQRAAGLLLGPLGRDHGRHH